jgi:hypothetical protein
MDNFFMNQEFDKMIDEEWLNKFDKVSRKKLKTELFSLELDNRVLRKKVQLLQDIINRRQKENKKSFFKKCCFWKH